jgi:exodeoxyribonuclease V gamma subunit
LVRVRAATVQPKDLIRAWCYHLFTCAAVPARSFSTLIVGTKGAKSFQPVPHAAAELEKLARIYADGQTRPLPFFPATSAAFAAALRAAKPKTESEARESAEKQWSGGDYTASEGDDGWNRVIWRPPAEPLGAEWQSLAVQVFEPLFVHLTEEAK